MVSTVVLQAPHSRRRAESPLHLIIFETVHFYSIIDLANNLYSQMSSGIRVGCRVRVIGGTTHIGKHGVIKRITAKMCWITSTCQPDPFRVMLTNVVLDPDDTASEAILAAETLKEVKVGL